MTLTTESLRAWLAQPNVVAFLTALELGEIPAKYRGTSDAYRVLYGGTLIDDLGRHPNVKVTAGGYTSTAAGRFQALYGTWSDFCRYLGETPDTVPFTPEFQDLFGVWCLQRRHALQDIVAGRIEAAVRKCAKEWASLPGSPYGQPVVTMDAFLAAYTGAGGTIDNGELLAPMPTPAEPVEAAESAQEQPQEFFMAPLFAAFLPAITSIVPELLKIFGASAKSDTAKRNVAVAGVISDAFVRGASAVNLQDAVEKAQADPIVAENVRRAVLAEQPVQAMLELGGGIPEARRADVAAAASGFWRSPAFWIAMLFVLPPLDFMVFVLIWRMPDPTEQLVTQVVTGLLGLAAVVAAFHFGSTMGSSRKTELIATRGAEQ